ncbi:amidohydrolase family protein [Shewanella olleyana]|uniref:metal-dependent hydrolase family protein n=1 Tax=Shewanella olleyana TaxID=135626 RepID=UPI00200C5046|nr:amidohydrolase family protein [Shewanella olleyana]MCL1067409.1 amidohydrolase family protein [Shewanella olleyana]
MLKKCIAISTLLYVSSFCSSVLAQDTPSENTILFTNVDVFDGVNDELIRKTNVLVTGNKITSISTENLSNNMTRVIDGSGHTLMPGIIEGHSHLALSGVTFSDVLMGLPGYQSIQSAVMAEDMLMNGVTSTRDMSGEVFSLKRAIDEGSVMGPRIYASGAMISQTSGHADFRAFNQKNPMLGGAVPVTDMTGNSLLVDGVPKMLAAVREQLRLGASQIKLAVGGSVSGPVDPLDTTQFTLEEIQAATTAAKNWGTYVTVHGYTSDAVNQAIDGGIKVVEHGQLLDRKTLRRMEKEGIWLSIQPFTECSSPNLTPAQNEKEAMVCKGTGGVYEEIKKLSKLKVVHGTDIFISPGKGIGVSKQVEQMERLLNWFTPYEILKMSTGNGGELLKLSGPRNPYPGDLGVVKNGALADLLLVKGNPLQDLSAITKRENLKIIMKDGVIYKDTIEQ